MYKVLSNQQWQNRMKTIETKNQKKYHRSLSWVSMFHHFNDCVIEHAEGIITIDEEKYKQIKGYLMSEEFNNKTA